ncbi:hypothetical protein [Sediminibacterium sp.]|uniref:hypothetical protein n=1 Tax=Sediminibacterium sp. TaxID=1917865 RepID=UPI003F716AED
MANEKLLTYGILNGELKHISTVSNGLSCKCICACCNQALVAKNNPKNKKVIHFAHHSGVECDGAFETSLHLLAKKILGETKTILTPQYHYDYNPENARSKFKKSRLVSFEEIILEKSIKFKNESFVPDAICVKQSKKLFIEFANTHFIDELKKNKIRKSGIACIEIDLSNQILDEESLKEFLLSDSVDIYWITNPKYDKEYLDFKLKKKLESDERRKKLAIENVLKMAEEEKINQEKIEKSKFK